MRKRGVGFVCDNNRVKRLNAPEPLDTEAQERWRAWRPTFFFGHNPLINGDSLPLLR